MTTQLLMIGPISSPVGGATVLFRQLVSELQGQSNVGVRVIDTSRRWDGSLGSAYRVVSLLFQALVLGCKSDVISLHVSSLRAAFFSIFIYLISGLTGRRWMLHIFGDASVKHRRMRDRERNLFDRLLRKCPLLLVETQQAVKYFQDRCPRVEWYPNNRPESSNAIKADSNSPKRFVFIGHVKPSKGVREIIALAAMLKMDVSVDVYGPLLDGVDAQEFRGKVHYCGELQHRQVATVLSQYDVFLYPTSYSGEGYPGAILEAFASGIPVITTKWQAISELVTPQNGILVEPGNAASLAAAMESCISNQREFSHLLEGARQTAQRFSSAAWTDRYIHLIAELIEGHRLVGTRERTWARLPN